MSALLISSIKKQAKLTSLVPRATVGTLGYKTTGEQCVHHSSDHVVFWFRSTSLCLMYGLNSSAS